MKNEEDESTTRLETLLPRKKWPDPTVPPPDEETLMAWFMDEGGIEATDGCWVEEDGVCPHGHPSWFLRMGLI